MKKREPNLLNRYYESQSRLAYEKSPLRIYVMVLVASIFIVLAFSAKAFFENKGLQAEIDDLNSFINNSTTQSQLEQVGDIDEKIASLDQIEVEVTSLLAVVNYIPTLSKQAFDTIYDYTSKNITIENYSYDLNTITINCVAKYASDFSNFVLNVKESDYFREVKNSGYSFDEELQVYTGSIQFILKGGK